jgi:glycosyltransferase involved in cell wall biosynthesis
MQSSLLTSAALATSQRIRVLQILPSFRVGGAEQMAGHLMSGLSGLVEVMGASLHPTTNSPIERRLKQQGIPLWHLDKRPGFDPRMYARIDRVLEEVQPQVVHTHLSVLRYVLPIVLRRRIPAVLHTLHNLAQHENTTFGRFVQWFAFRGSVLPVAISQQVALSFRQVYGLECKAIVPNGIPVDGYSSRPHDGADWKHKEGFDREAILFTCVGRLEPQKNPLLLVRAMAALDDPRAHLVLLGEGTLKSQIVEYVRDHGLEGRVHLLGKRNEVAECLAASDAFVLGSNWEGNPLAVMEAMSAGLPVISTAVGGVPELVKCGVHGILVPPEDREALTAAMRWVLDRPESRVAMGNAARKHAVEAFGMERMAEGYAGLYRAALLASPPAVSTLAMRSGSR